MDTPLLLHRGMMHFCDCFELWYWLSLWFLKGSDMICTLFISLGLIVCLTSAAQVYSMISLLRLTLLAFPEDLVLWHQLWTVLLITWFTGSDFHWMQKHLKMFFCFKYLKQKYKNTKIQKIQKTQKCNQNQERKLFNSETLHGDRSWKPKYTKSYGYWDYPPWHPGRGQT